MKGYKKPRIYVITRGTNNECVLLCCKTGTKGATADNTNYNSCNRAYQDGGYCGMHCEGTLGCS